MPAVVTDDGVRPHAEETGQAEPILFVHEFAGDHRRWSRRSGSSPRPTTASRSRPPAIRRPTCPPIRPRTRRNGRSQSAIAVLDRPGHRQGARRRPVHRRLHRVHLVLGTRSGSARRSSPALASSPSPITPTPSTPGSVLTAAAFAAEGAAKVAERYAIGQAGSSSRTRTRAAGPSSPRRWPGIPRWVAP